MDVELATETPQLILTELTSKDLDSKIIYRAFESIEIKHTPLSDFGPKPVAWGTYETISDLHFFLCRFREMTGNI